MNSTYFRLGKAPAGMRQWHVLDAKDQPLGRLATQAAELLRGKHKTTFTPYLDEGDFVVVLNSSLVKLTGNKIDQKTAFSHSIHPGGLRLIPYRRLLAEQPEKVIIRAVSGMLSKSKMRARMLTRLKVYKDAVHPHSAQQPQAYALS